MRRLECTSDDTAAALRQARPPIAPCDVLSYPVSVPRVPHTGAIAEIRARSCRQRGLARTLVDELRNHVAWRDNMGRRLFPEITLTSQLAAVRRALEETGGEGTEARLCGQEAEGMAGRLVLVTGATGYVGGRLVPRLLESGYRVRVLARDPARLQGRPWSDQVEVAAADVLRPETLPAAMAGVTDAYYLIHSMRDPDQPNDRDIIAARYFGAASRDAGVRRIIYLGGLGDPATHRSPHLRSRHQTGDVLRESGVPVTEFRCSIIVGSGSVSFEIIRYLTERFPILLCPKWTFTRVQPIGIRDTLNYLITALGVPESVGEIVEIGGADVVTYRDMMKGYARARGLSRLFLPTPMLTDGLSAYWVHGLTPIPADMARPLIEALSDETLVRSDLARRLFPSIEPMNYASALHLALERLEKGQVETIWSDALATSQGDLPPITLHVQEGFIAERRIRVVAAPARDVFRIFSGIGGQRGWMYADWTWIARGALDRLIGGVGLRRGRRHPDEILVGEALDFWRVEAVEQDRLLRLRAEMKVPGAAWLEFEVRPQGESTSILVQTAYFDPKGLPGLAYWYCLYPIHTLIFSGLIDQIGRRAMDLAAAGGEETRTDRHAVGAAVSKQL